MQIKHIKGKELRIRKTKAAKIGVKIQIEAVKIEMEVKGSASGSGSSASGSGSSASGSGSSASGSGSSASGSGSSASGSGSSASGSGSSPFGLDNSGFSTMVNDAMREVGVPRCDKDDFLSLVKVTMGDRVFTAATKAVPFIGMIAEVTNVAALARKAALDGLVSKKLGELSPGDFHRHRYFWAVKAVIQYRQEHAALEAMLAGITTASIATRAMLPIGGSIVGAMTSIFTELIVLAFQLKHKLKADKVLGGKTMSFEDLIKAPILGAWILGYERNTHAQLNGSRRDEDEEDHFVHNNLGHKAVRGVAGKIFHKSVFADKEKPETNQFKIYRKAIKSAHDMINDFPFSIHVGSHTKIDVKNSNRSASISESIDGYPR
jgi:hypothetical protein